MDGELLIPQPADLVRSDKATGGASARAAGAGEHVRRPLVATATLLAEDLHGRAHHGRTAEDYSPEFQVCLPYWGLFAWHVGGDEVIADANQVLFVAGGESFFMRQPVANAYAELIITPHPSTLAELAHASDGRMATHPLFRRRSRRASLDLQFARSRLLRTTTDTGDTLTREEAVLDLLRRALNGTAPAPTPSASTRRLVSRAKEFLEAHLSSTVHLDDVSRAIGASPAYLTDTFRRIEGVPLHQYLVQLRLARALAEVPHATDLTALALGLGFSSHSHFTVVFRRAFGLTPSAYRDGGPSSATRAACTAPDRSEPKRNQARTLA